MTGIFYNINQYEGKFLPFGISFGYIGASVVYYLRLLCYPSGFSFPLNFPLLNIPGVEIAREVAIIFLLLSVSFFLDKTINMKWFPFLFTNKNLPISDLFISGDFSFCSSLYYII